MTVLEPNESRTLIEQLLAEQQTLTAVERFARAHDQNAEPAQAKYYRALIPLAKPQPGEQYAFVVELDRCSGCKACVSACHSLNGLDEDELWRSVGLLVGSRLGAPASRRPYLQTITTACHHCIEPACALGCPVLAYEKDPLTGIVRHLDDQCIGCQYCVLKCPYEVPKYSASKGIVRKCDMCHSRLAVGEAPACVQACPHEAIRINIVNQNAVRIQTSFPGERLVPGAFDSNYTHPATRYESEHPIPSAALPADADVVRPQPAHWPLVFMLLLTQMAGGLHLLNALLPLAARSALRGTGEPALAWFGVTCLFSGLASSVLHLGRPLKAWRVFLGWRRSWMSREIIAFSGYGLLAGLLAARPSGFWMAPATALAALAGIACSAMIYVDTRRPGWRAALVFPNFFGTSLLLGSSAAAVWWNWTGSRLAPRIGLLSLLLSTALFAWEFALDSRAAAKRRQRRKKKSPFSAFCAACAFLRLLLQLPRQIGNLRYAGGAGVLFAAASALSILGVWDVSGRGVFWAALAFGATFAWRVLERYTFFVATPAPRMPGGVSA